MEDRAVQYFNEGVNFAENGRYSDAVISYETAIAINPNIAEAWYNRGIALDELGQYSEAVASYDKAITINPNDAEVWYNRGDALRELGQYSEAVASYDKAITIDPNDTNTWSNRGDALRELGQYSEAGASYNKAIQLDPQNEFALAEKNKLLNKIHFEQQENKIKKEVKMDQNTTSDETIREEENRTIKITSSPEINYESTQLEIKKFRDFTIDYAYPATGGEADIFKAIDKNKTYIIKIYRHGIVPKEQVLKKVQYVSRKYPQHFIELIDYGFDDSTKRWFEIQEYATFGSFKGFKLDIIDRKTILIKIVRQIADALKTLHQDQLVHLDLKPANILIRTQSPLDLVLADFGISSIMDPNLSIIMTETKGTPPYWAPEQLSGVVSYATDYWALGIIILELLNGKHPFDGIDNKVIIYTLTTQGVDVPDGLPDDFDLLVKGLLTQDPKKRWGYEEISHWIDGDRNIPIHYQKNSLIIPNPVKLSEYTFLENKYSTIESIMHAFIDDEESWNSAKSHIGRGYPIKWLERNEMFDQAAFLSEVLDKEQNPDIQLLLIYTHFLSDSPFIMQGHVIDVNNIKLFISKFVRKESSSGESKIVQDIFSGTLQMSYNNYVDIKKIVPDPDMTKIFRFCLENLKNEDIVLKKSEMVLKYIDLLSEKDGIKKRAYLKDFNPEVFIEIGKKFDQINAKDEAKESFKDGITYFDEFYQSGSGQQLQKCVISNKKGHILLMIHDYESALTSFNEAIQLCPDTLAFIKDCIQASESAGKPNEEILVLIERYLGKKNDDSDMWVYRGKMLSSLKRYQEAIRSFYNATKYNENSGEAFVGKGNVLLLMRHFDKAIICFDEAIKLDKKYIPAWEGKMNALMASGKMDGVKDCKKILNELTGNR